MKLRIISGKFGSQQIDSPSGHKTHPMSEKLRGAIFNSLGDIKGLSLLDAYSGSGAIALEAISRGANNVIAIDSSKLAVQAIKKNALALGAELKVTQANISSWQSNNPSLRFDIVVCDPPYDSINFVHIKNLVNAIKPGGVFIISIPPKLFNEINDLSAHLSLITKKDYGDAMLVFYRRIR